MNKNVLQKLFMRVDLITSPLTLFTTIIQQIFIFQSSSSVLTFLKSHGKNIGPQYKSHHFLMKMFFHLRVLLALKTVSSYQDLSLTRRMSDQFKDGYSYYNFSVQDCSGVSVNIRVIHLAVTILYTTQTCMFSFVVAVVDVSPTYSFRKTPSFHYHPPNLGGFELGSFTLIGNI